MHITKIENNFAPAPEFPVRELRNKDLKDGIVVRVPNWLGDVVMTLPALMQLRKMLPEYCGLFVVCAPGMKPLFQALPMVNYVLCLEQAHKNWSNEDLKLLTKLHAGVGILFNNSLRDAIFMRLGKVRNLYGAKARGRSLLLRRSLKFPPRISHDLNQLHHANKYLSIVKAMGAPEWEGDLPEFDLPEDLSNSSKIIQKVCQHPKLLTLAAGAAYGGSKRWDAENFQQVASWWISQGGIIAALGTAKEKDMAAEAIADLPEDKAYNLAGASDMTELMCILRSAEMCLANDSGIMHLSAILGKPGVAVFGPTDHSATSPISNNWKIIYHKQECSPCFKRECPKGTRDCMNACSAEEVIDAIKEIENNENIAPSE